MEIIYISWINRGRILPFWYGRANSNLHLYHNDDSNMICFVGSAPNDDYRFGKIKFLHATDDYDIPEYGIVKH